MREAVGALVVCANAPESSPPDASGDIAEREDVRALRDVMRGIGAVKEKIDEDRGGVGDVSGVFVLVGPRKVPASSSKAGSKESESELGGDLGDDLGDVVPLSVSWWEDQFYDMGLLGWEVIEWDPKEGGEETRNQYGGMLLCVHSYLPVSGLDFCAHANLIRTRGYAEDQRSSRNPRLVHDDF